MATQVSDTGSKSRTRGTSEELAVIAQRAQAFTNASGTAIALSEGSSDQIICRARSGASAPDVGTTLRVEGSFTGLCIQSGKELRCDDAETDTRVDTAAIRALGIRSMVVTPIKEENRVVGVLAVFAPTAHAFTITHVAVLKTMADQISNLLQRERRGGEESHEPEPVQTSVPVAISRPVAAGAAPVLPPPVLIKPAPSAPAPRAAYPVVAKVEPIRTSTVAVPLAAPLALPKREEKHAEPKPEHRASFGTFDAVAAEEKKSGKRWIFLGVAVVAIAAISIFAFFKMRRPVSPSSAPHVQESPAQALTSQPVAPVQAATGSAPPPFRAEAVSPAPVSLASVAPTAATGKHTVEGGGNDKKAEKDSAKPESPSPAAKRTPETVALSSGPSRIASAAASDTGQRASDTTPSLTVGGGSASGSLPALASPAASTTPSMLSQSTLEPIQVLKRVAPIYPAVAKQRMLSGTVVLQGLVGKDGKISNLQMVSGLPVFREASFEAAKQWQFKPARLNGQPIEQSTEIHFDFRPAN